MESRLLGRSKLPDDHSVPVARHARRRFMIPPETAHVMHIIAWVLGAIDVVIVGACLLLEGH